MRITPQEAELLDKMRGDVSVSVFVRKALFGTSAVLAVEDIRKAVKELRDAAPQMTPQEVGAKLAEGMAKAAEPKKRGKHFTDTW